MRVKVGIFDSGIGGLSILKEIHQLNKSLDIYYYADSKNNPYGSKSNEFILDRCVTIVDEFIDKGVALIIIACNTATAVAIDELRRLYPQINFVGVEPYINVINKRDDLKDKKGVVLATPRTGSSQRFIDLKTKLDPNGLLDSFFPVNLAKIIEENFLTKGNIKSQLEVELEEIVDRYDFYILGCTHYPLIVDQISEVLVGELVSPCSKVASHALSLIEASFYEELESFNFKRSGPGGAWERLQYSNVF